MLYEISMFDDTPRHWYPEPKTTLKLNKELLNVSVDSLYITCDKIVLEHDNLNIDFRTKDIKDFKTITINGVKFERK